VLAALRHLPRRRAIQGSDKITPIDQPRELRVPPSRACLDIDA
jgi:hypothetical protein